MAIQVYTATDEFQDGDNTVRYPHTDYFINWPNGSRYKFVANHITRSDEMPEAVELPPGKYIVVGEEGLGACVHVPVIVKAGRTTGSRSRTWLQRESACWPGYCRVDIVRPDSTRRFQSAPQFNPIV